MADTILHNNEEYHITEDDLPCLVTYKEKAGGSHFSITLIADLFLQGSKILFLSAYPMARENFFGQVKGYESQIATITSINELKTQKDSRVIIPESGNEELFLEILHTLPDLHERVVLIKNMEVFSPTLLNQCLKLQKVIFSGNIDTGIAKQEIIAAIFKTTIVFTQPETPLPFTVPPLEKYTGYMQSESIKGFVNIKQ